MRCTVCGEELGVVHNCRGSSVAASVAALEPPPRLRFAPLYYFRQAWAIAFWNEEAIQRASRDNNALVYGLLFLSLALVVPVTANGITLTSRGIRIPYLQVGVAFLFQLGVTAFLFVLQYGLCHAVAKWKFQARGTFLGVSRALLLGSVVYLVGIVPFVGFIAAALWSTAVVMIVFEEVDGIERMQAFGLALFFGLLINGLLLYLAAMRMAE